MIVLSPSFVLDEGSQYYAEANLDNPIIGYHNIVNADTLAASSEQEEYPLVNLFNSATNLWWKAADDTEQTLTVTTGSADDMDYVAIARHNFGSAQIPVSIEVDTGSGYVEEIAPYQPADDSPLIFRITTQAYSGIRLVMAADGLEEARIGIFQVGKLLVLQRRIYVDHTPLHMGVETEIATGQSEIGEFLGRIVLSEERNSSINQNNLSPGWVRTYLNPFIEHARTNPFFFAWRPDTYPDEVGFAWTKNSPKPVNQRNNGMMQVRIDIGGLIL